MKIISQYKSNRNLNNGIKYDLDISWRVPWDSPADLIRLVLIERGLIYAEQGCMICQWAIVIISVVNNGRVPWGRVLYDRSATGVVTVSILRALRFTSWGSSNRHHSEWTHCMRKPEWSKFIPTMKPYIPLQHPCGYVQRLGASETCRYGFPFGFKPRWAKCMCV